MGGVDGVDIMSDKIEMRLEWRERGMATINLSPPIPSHTHTTSQEQVWQGFGN